MCDILEQFVVKFQSSCLGNCNYNFYNNKNSSFPIALEATIFSYLFFYLKLTSLSGILIFKYSSISSRIL